jgi:hypothetical protein
VSVVRRTGFSGRPWQEVLASPRAGSLARTLFGVTVALAVAQVVILARAETPMLSGEFSDNGFPLVTLAAVAASGVGLLIVRRHPGHPIGWLFLLGQAGTMLGLASESYGFNSLTDGFGPTALAHQAIWVSTLFGAMFALTLVALLLLLVPDGRLLSPRWRWAARATVAGLACHDGAVLLLVSPGELDAEAHVTGAPAVLSLFALLGAAGISAGLIAGACSLVLRLRRAAGDERARLKWVAAPAAGLAAAIPLAFALHAVPGVPIWVTLLPLMLSYLALPVCTGVAILRYRLYDVDLLVNRSISLAALTAFVTVGYVVLVVVLGRFGGDHLLGTSLVASVMVALAFQPLRRRVTGMADRLVYGAQAVPYEALAAFNEELRHGSSVSDLLPRVAEATGRTVGAERVEVWVEQEPGEPLAATWPSDLAETRPEGSGRPPSPGRGPSAGGEHEVTFSVTADGEALGGLTVAMAPGRGLRADEKRLLSTFAAQLGAAFRARRLEAALASRVELLASQREQLERSRLRLLSAQSVERVRFESAIARDVLPHIATLPRDVHDLVETSKAGPWPTEDVERLIDRVTDALASLRTLTRGVFPAQLARRGLVEALTAHLQETGVPHRLSTDDQAGQRFSAEVETVAYFCAVELLRSAAGLADVEVTVTSERLRVTVTGGPFDVDIDHLVDRAEARGGRVLCQRQGDRTRVVVELPVGSGAVGEPDRLEPLGVEG